MKFEVDPRSATAVVRGAPAEIDRIQHSLAELVRQTARASRSAPALLGVRRGARELEAFVGALLAVGELQDRPAPQPSAASVIEALKAGGYLRDYQAAACRAALSAPLGRCIVDAPTGSGKSRMACALAQAGGGKWAYLAPNKQLASQTQDTAPQSMICTTFGSASAPLLRDCYGIIVDECHRLSARTYSRSIMRSWAVYRIGLSATPLLRQDDKNALVIGLLGPVVSSIDIRTLQERGFLAKGTVVSLTCA